MSAQVNGTMLIENRRHVMMDPPTTGEIEELAERWGQIAEDQEDFLILQCLFELLAIREQQEEQTMERMQRDLMAARASCDDDVESCYGEGFALGVGA